MTVGKRLKTESFANFMLKPIGKKGNEKWRKEKLQRYHYLVMDFITLFLVVSVFFTASA